jgi:hypothetical protein
MLVATVAPEAFTSYVSIAGQVGNNNSSGTTSQRVLPPLSYSIEMDGRDSFLSSALIDYPSPRVPQSAGLGRG